MEFLGTATLLIWVGLFLYTGTKFARSIRMVPNRNAYIVERLGKYHQTLGPGLHVLIPFIDKVAFTQDLREKSIEVPPQDCFTKDNVKVEVDGVLYISVEDPQKASYGVTDYITAAILLAQTTTRSVVGTLDLDRTFEERDEINSRVVAVLDEVADTWGIKVHRYEIKNIVPPGTVRDSMERQMAAERQRRALLAESEGQKQSMINESEGRMQELINNSEGDMQRRINEAQGRSEEILAIAQATADSIRKVGQSLTMPGGAEATRLRLGQAYLKELGKLGRPATKVLVPADITGVDNLLKSLGLDVDAAEAEVAQLQRAATPAVPAVARAAAPAPSARAATPATSTPPTPAPVARAVPKMPSAVGGPDTLTDMPAVNVEPPTRVPDVHRAATLRPPVGVGSDD